MYDPVIGGRFDPGDRDAVADTRWWGGEPIWVTAEKQGVKAATMFWPGIEAEIAGERPSYWHRFDKGFSFVDRVAQVLAWLDLPAAQRPRVITLYFEYPNDVSHHFGPDARETHAAVSEVDGRIGDLLAGLEARGLREDVDLVITSDHGMAEVSIDRVVVFDDYVEFGEGELFEQGAVVQIFPNPGREETHGQDPSDPSLHGLFVASGPSFKEGLRIERFESVEIYNLLAAVLELEPAPNDGDPISLSAILNR